ncbi:MAG: hypothetical protein Fur005_25310 [Roseiflexaceae bacterium]
MIVLIAITLRLIFWQNQALSGAVQPGDPEEYYRAALHLLQGSYHDNGKWLRPPLYPLFLAGSFLIGGVDLSSTMLIQAILTGLCTPLYGFLAYALFRQQGVALLSGLIAALYVPLASFGSTLFAEGLFVLFAMAFLWALVQAGSGGWRWALLAGILLGFAALTRAVALSFLPLAVAWITLAKVWPLWQWRAWAIRSALAFVLGTALVISPWALRNYLVHQRLILSDTNGGISMWYGVVQSEAEQASGEAELWATPNLADRQALALRWTIEKVRHDPTWFVGRMRFKIVSLYLLQTRNYAVGDVITIDPRDQLVAMGAGELPFTWSLIADGEYLLILAAVVIGLLTTPRKRDAIPILLWAAFLTFMSAITIGHPRLRLPIIAALIPLAAYGLIAAVAWLRRPQIRSGWQWRLAGLAFGWLVIAGLVFSTRYIGWARTLPLIQQANAAEASTPGAGYTLFEQANAADPSNALRAIDLGDSAFRSGNYRLAQTWYAEANRREDRNLYARAMQIRLAGLLNQPALARQQQAILAGYGRDSNEVYAWAWATFGDPPRMQVVPGDPSALGQYIGFAPATADLSQGRWTLGQARIRLADRCGDVVVRLRGPVGRVVTLTVAEHAITQKITLNGTEQELRLSRPCTTSPQASPAAAQLVAAPGSNQQGTQTLAISSNTGLIDLEHDPWYGGVAIIEARIDPADPIEP